MQSSDTMEGSATDSRKSAGLASTVKQRAEHLKEQYLDELWGKTRSYAKENPGKAILISIAVGFALGRLLRRR